MSTNLQLCQDLARECGIARGAAVPTTVVSQTGELARVVEWVVRAWNDIQGMHVAPGWRWMRSRWTVNTVADDDTYAGTDCTDSRLSAVVSRFRRWIHLDSYGYSNVTMYLQSTGVAGESYLNFMPWEDFRHRYKRGTQTSSRPAHFTIDPQNNLVLGPKPSAVYVLQGEYRMSNQVLDDDADTPEMPSDFHDLIVYRAMLEYGMHSVAAESLAAARLNYAVLLDQLRADQLEAIETAGPLA